MIIKDYVTPKERINFSINFKFKLLIMGLKSWLCQSK